MQAYSIRKWLNIPQYKITGIISESDKEIHIRLEPYKRRVFVCSGCGEVHQIGYHGIEESVVEDLALFEKRVYLHVVKRRYKCPEDNRIHIEEVPWVRKWGRVTKRFAERVNRLTAITTNQEAGWFLGLDDEVVYRIDKEILEEKAREKLMPPPSALNISVDEVSYRKYHRYLTNVIDVDKRLVIWNRKGRKAEVLDRYYAGVGEESCQRIESVALDGAKHYISSTNRYAVNALIVYDRFHIIQKLNGAVDMVRKEELRKARADENNELIELTNCRQRFILLKNKNKLTEKQANYLQRLCEINQPIYKAMLLKESFLQIYSYSNMEEAKAYLTNWITEALSSSLEVFKILAQSFTQKMQYIINWFRKKISSAISEGFNNKIKRLKRMAYGYKDIEYFRLKIHQHCGLLNPRRFPL
jgi:transposase